MSEIIDNVKKEYKDAPTMIKLLSQIELDSKSAINFLRTFLSLKKIQPPKKKFQ